MNLSTLFESLSGPFWVVIFPTLAIVFGFGYAAHKAHLKHVARIQKIKQGYYLPEDD